MSECTARFLLIDLILVPSHLPALRAQKNMDKNAVAAVCTAVVEDMNAYGIGREDLQETLWTLNTYGRFDEAAIPTAVKSALTRTCTKIGKVFSLDALVKSVSSADAEGALADDDGLVAEEASEVREIGSGRLCV